MVPFWRRLFAAAVMLSLATSAVSSATFAAMACAKRGLVVTGECCCPSQPASTDPGMSRATCCTSVELQVDRPPYVPGREAADLVDTAGVELPTGEAAAHLTAPLPRPTFVGSRHGPSGRDVLISKRSFLI